MTRIRLLVALFVAIAAGTTLAQTAAPAAGAAPAAVPAAGAPGTQTCVKPGRYPGKKASDNKKEAWIADMQGTIGK